MRAVRQSCGRKPPGFTLIELMVVLMLIGIMTAVIIPEMQGTYQDAILRATCRELINACDLAASRSISLNQIHRVLLDVRTGKYVIEKRVHGGEAEGAFVPVKDVPGGQGELDKRIAVEVRHANGGPAQEYQRPAAGQEQTDRTAAAAGGEANGDLATEEGITFYPEGTADAREILLRDPAGFRLGLHLNPVTGHLRVIELERK